MVLGLKLAGCQMVVKLLTIVALIITRGEMSEAIVDGLLDGSCWMMLATGCCELLLLLIIIDCCYCCRQEVVALLISDLLTRARLHAIDRFIDFLVFMIILLVVAGFVVNATVALIDIAKLLANLVNQIAVLSHMRALLGYHPLVLGVRLHVSLLIQQAVLVVVQNLLVCCC